jgi:hypothetical protein
MLLIVAALGPPNEPHEKFIVREISIRSEDMELEEALTRWK